VIDGVIVTPLRRIADERGTILHMLKATDPHFQQFGEIYFATAYKGVVKGWHRHRDMTLNYACVFGRVKLVIHDDRQGSASRGETMELFLGPDNHSLVSIPPELWNGYKGLSDPFAMIANCCTHPHDPARTTRLDPFGGAIPYDWNLRHG
jgi:dTDP-4-dehydrorhamnose 3,5-epimerase